MDILFQIAPRWDAQGVANTGFIVIRNTAKTRISIVLKQFLTTTRQNEIALRVMYLNKSKQFDLLIAAELVIPFEIDVIDIDRKQE
eukprot:779704-Amorphochlora_amoeboformis.AAC.1